MVSTSCLWSGKKRGLWIGIADDWDTYRFEDDCDIVMITYIDG